MGTPNQSPTFATIKRIWLGIVKGFLRLGNSIINAGFYIIWSIVLPLTIIFASQGNEMTEYIFFEKNALQLASILVSLVMLGYALWIVPALFLHGMRLVLKTKKTKYQLFDLLNNNRKDLGATHLELRLFAIVPLSIFIGGLLIPQIHSSINNLNWLKKCDENYILSIIIIIVLAFLLFWAQRVFYPLQKRLFLFALHCQIVQWLKIKLLQIFYKDASPNINLEATEADMSTVEKYRIVLINGNMFNVLNLLGKTVFLLLLIVLCPIFFESRILLICYLAFFVLWHYGVLQFIDNKSYVEVTKIDPNTPAARFADFVMMRFNYNFLLIVITVLFGWIIYKSTQNHIGFFSPLFIIGVLFTFFLLVFDVFYKTPKLLINLLAQSEKPTMRMSVVRVLLFLMMIGFWFFAIFGNLNQHRIRKYVATENYIHPDQRATLQEFYAHWLAQRDSIQTIFLVAGQGGGSRAAAWTHLCLDTLNIHDNFLPNVLAFSTASGSSVGVNMLLAQQKINARRYRIEGEDTIDAVRNLYRRNYFSNSFYGLLFGDMLEGVLNRRKHFNIDRNYRLQKEELTGFLKTFAVNNRADSLRVIAHFEKDYLKLYYERSGVLLKNKSLPPLFLINTTRVQDANRVVISPIKLDSADAIDFYSYFKFSNLKNAYALPTVTAVGQSQAFPLISSQNFVEHFGNLADGGFVENSGCGTLLELYQALRTFVNPNVRIVVVDLQNSGSIYDAAYNRPKFDSIENINSTVKSMLCVVSKTGVSAYSDFWREKLRRQTLKHPNDTFLSIGLDQSITLARMLSYRSLDSMSANLRQPRNGSKIKYIHSLLKHQNHEH